MQTMRSKGSVYQSVMLYVAMFLLVSGCASSGNQRLVIDTRQVPAIQYLPNDVTAMLEDLGYEVIPETDAAKRARTFEDYKMQFKARDEENIRVDVDFRLVDKLTRIHLYNTDEKTPGAATIQRYNALKMRVQQAFGVDSVK